jgi:hypothetical protein
MKSEREESLGYDNREPKGQQEYAKGQHDLCCQELGLEPRHDREGDTLLEAVCALKNERDEWKEESALHQKEHERLAAKIEAIEKKALEIIPGYGNTGKSTFSTPIAVMGRMRDEIDLLRKELEDERVKALDWFCAYGEMKMDFKTALQWIDDGNDQEGRDMIVEPFRAKYFPPKADPSLDSENAKSAGTDASEKTL